MLVVLRQKLGGLQQQQRWIGGKTSNSLAMLPKRRRLRRRWCVCLARHAPFAGASHGKSLWASIPPRVSVYLHNPQATLHRPAQTDISGGDGGTMHGCRSAQSSCYREAIPDLITMVWSSQVGTKPNLRSLVHSSSPQKIMFGWLVSVCVCTGERCLFMWVTVSKSFY